MEIIYNIDLIPYELLYHIVLSLPYSSVLAFCLTNHQYYLIWQDAYFWNCKMDRDFYQKLTNQTQLKCHQYYLQLLAKYGLSCERGSELCIDINVCITLAALQNNLLLVKYFIQKDNSMTDLKEASINATKNSNRLMINYLISIIEERSQMSYELIDELVITCSSIGNIDLLCHLLSIRREINKEGLSIWIPVLSLDVTLKKALKNACLNGHLSLVDYLLNKCHIKYNSK